jgi:2-desacetyl-2-hydroxyethyl bacteriochlorophyllide A dehydrogenase
METNSSVVFKAPKMALLETSPMPTPAVGEVLIRTRCTLISTGTELTVLEGVFPADSEWARHFQFPHVPGYNNVGDVVAVGPGVDADLIGKRVASYGAHASYVIQPVKNLFPIRPDLADEAAVFFAIPLIVANAIRRSHLVWGEAAVVFGLGLLGQFAVRFCRLCGARPVFAVDISDRRLAFLPCDHQVVRVNPERQAVADVVRQMTKGRMADVVFEVTGSPELIPKEFAPLHEQGRFVVLSSPRGKTRDFDFHDLCNRPSFTIIGTHNFSHPPAPSPDNPWTMARHAEFFFDLAADGELDVRQLISETRMFTDAPTVYAELLRNRSEAMGVIFKWPGSL